MVRQDGINVRGSVVMQTKPLIQIVDNVLMNENQITVIVEAGNPQTRIIISGENISIDYRRVKLYHGRTALGEFKISIRPREALIFYQYKDTVVHDTIEKFLIDQDTELVTPENKDSLGYTLEEAWKASFRAANEGY